MPNQTDILKALTELAARDDEVAALWLYGSRAKGTAGEESDFDLAVAFHSFELNALERRLRPELLAQSWQDELGLSDGKLSIVDINLAPLPLAHVIIRTGKLIHANDRLRVIREENRITSMWELDHQYHQRHYA